MNVLVIEDELLAADRLIAMIMEIDKTVEVVGRIESVRNAVLWFDNHPAPDLIFMDIHLADGISFQIFEKASVQVPVIFTTAYNEYALRAFKVNSIDYLLKPIDKEELKGALGKFLRVRTASVVEISAPPANYSVVMKEMMEMMQNRYKTRFVIRVGEHIKTILAEDVVFFYSNDKASYIRTVNGRDFALDSSLEQLENEVNPKYFFRVSRKYLVALAHIQDIVAYSGSRYKLVLVGNSDNEILVSREKVTDFKKWLEG